MPEYEVINSSEGTIPVCSLLCWDAEYNRLTILKVKGMTGEGGKVLVGEKIIVGTTNKEIIPEDICPASRIE